MKKRLWKRSAPWRRCVWFASGLSLLACACGPFYGTKPKPVNASYNPAAVTSTLQQQAAPQAFPSQPTTAPQVQFPVQQRSVTRVPPTRNPVPAPALPNRDTTFDIQVPFPAIHSVSGTELHVMGVYQGSSPAGAKEQPWWAKCARNSDGSLQNPSECHSQYAGQRQQHEITVNISYHEPTILALMSYEPVLWNIQGSTSDLQHVLLAGYHGQDIKGVDPAVPVDVYTYEASDCSVCRKQSDYFYTYKTSGNEYKKTLAKLKKITGLVPSSFQTSYKARSFSLTSSIVGHGAAHTDAELQTGESVYDMVMINDEKIRLPPGHWQVLINEKISLQQEQDTLISFAQIQHGRLTGLYAVRLRNANNQQGFPQNFSCNKGVGNFYFSEAKANNAQGEQLCYWGEYLERAWEQPIFKRSAAILKKMDISYAQDAFNTAFHKADRRMSLTGYYYVDPQSEGITTDPSDFNSIQLWDPRKIDQDPARETLVKKQEEWAKLWIQFFRLP